MSLEDRRKWDAKYADPSFPSREPSQVLVGLDDLLPRKGQALEIAGGGGRNSIWLAKRGLDVTLADISPVGLAIARERAAEAGVKLTTIEADLELGPLPPPRWDLILSVCFLHRPIFARYTEALAGGGMLVVIQPTKRNLERHAKPPADFLLDEGELPKLVTGLEIVRQEEGWLADDRHDALVVARRSIVS